MYYEDTDAGGIVYHARYLHFLERARTEWLRMLGFNQSELKALGTVFVVRDLNLKYIKPARLDDQLMVLTRIEKVKKASLIMQQEICTASSDGKISNESGKILVAQASIACLDAHSLKPKAMPQEISANL